MVRLVACDVDGTLIPYGQTALPPDLFAHIRRLREMGILFCPASGRQYHSLRLLFAPVADEVCFLCENGAVVYGAGKEDQAPVLSLTAMPREPALALSHAILERSDCCVLISGRNMAYVCRCDESLRYDLEHRLHSRVTEVRDPAEIGEEIIKVSAHCPEGTAPAAEALAEPFGREFSMAVAGPDWLDFTLADKGTGLRGLCRALGISPEEVMAIGDNWNDEAMLALAGFPVLMESAPAPLLARYLRCCARVTELLAELERGRFL